MIADHWPTYAVRIRTPRLCLRLPDDDELAALANVAAQGVHPPGEQPFLIPWTDGTTEQRAQDDPSPPLEPASELAADQLATRTRCLPWRRPRRNGEHVGPRLLDCSRGRLGLTHQGGGIGTEARTGLLTFAFEYLDATDAVTQVFPENHASRAVSRKLGYTPDGISRDERGGEAVISHRLRLTAAEWAARDHVPVTVECLDQARSMFVE